MPVDLQKLVEHVQDTSPDPSPVSRLAAAVSVAARTASVADDLVDHFVRAARQAGSSWAEIGLALGVTRQAAQQRFAAVPASAGAPCDVSLPLSAPARRALRDAHRDADRAGVGVGTAHLLAAILRNPRVLAVKILHAVGADPADVARALQPAPEESPGQRAGNAACGADLMRVLRRAAAEATSHGHDYIGTEHLLLALFDEPTPAADALSACGVDYSTARAKALQFLTGVQPPGRRRRLRASVQP